MTHFEEGNKVSSLKESETRNVIDNLVNFGI